MLKFFVRVHGKELQHFLRIRSSEKFLSFHKQIMDAQYFSFYIILSNYAWSILFYQNKDYNVRQISFHVRIKMHRCKRWVCKRKTLFGQSNTLLKTYTYCIIFSWKTATWKWRFSIYFRRRSNELNIEIHVQRDMRGYRNEITWKLKFHGSLYNKTASR